MPFVYDSDSEAGPRFPRGVPPPALAPKADMELPVSDVTPENIFEADDPIAAMGRNLEKSGQVIGAAGIRQNLVVNAYRYLRDRTGFTTDPNHNPLDIIAGTKYEADYLDNFLNSWSEPETRTIMRHIDEEEAARETLAGAGGFGIVAEIGAGIADPTIFMPGAVFVKGGRAGWQVGRLALGVGAAAGAQAAVQEGVLAATQETRTGGEVALNIGSAAILGGLLGSGAGALLSRTQRQGLTEVLAMDRKAMAADLSPEPSPVKPMTEFEGRRFIDQLGASAALTADEEAAITKYVTVDEPALWLDDGFKGALGSASKKMALPHDVIVFRGDSKNATPQSRVDAGHWTPVSLSRSWAETMAEAKWANPQIQTIRLKKGTPVVAIHKGDGNELELLIPPETAFERVGARSDPDYRLSNGSQTADEWEVSDYIAMPQAAGAAATDVRQLKLKGYYLDKLPGVRALTERVSPTMRIWSSDFVTARRTLADLAETPLRFEDNAAGIATTQGGPAVDRMARMLSQRARAASGQKIDQMYAKYRFGQTDVGFTGAQVAKIKGAVRPVEGKLSPIEFREGIGKAMRAGDKSEIPEIAEAAQFLRREVFEPWKERAIKAGLLPEGVETATAESYFMRVYNKRKIDAQRPVFQGRVADWLGREQANKAAIKEKLAWHDAQLTSWEGEIAKYERRLETLDRQESTLETRLSERAMEVRRAEARADTLAERAQSVGEEIADVEALVADLRQQVKDPDLLARVDELDRRARALARGDKPATEAQLRKLDEEEAKGILTPPIRRAAEIITGRRKMPKAPSFLSWLKKNGGIKDTGGDVKSIVGGKVPGLISGNGQALDKLGVEIQEKAEGFFPRTEEPGGGAPEPDDVLGWISDALNGKDPDWWRATVADPEDADAAAFAAAMQEMFDRAGVEVKNTRDVANALRGNSPVSLTDLDRVAAEMEAAGEAIPVSIRRQDGEDTLFVEKSKITDIRRMIGEFSALRDQKARQAAKIGVQSGEAAIPVRASTGRLGVLEERLSLADQKRQIIEDALGIAQRERQAVQDAIEEQVTAWKGKSAWEAQKAIEKRVEAAAEKPEGAARSVSADKAVSAAVRRMLAADTDLSPDEILSRAGEIVDRISAGPDGRLSYDAASGGPKVGFTGDGPAPRGPLAAREFMIPDSEIEDFLVSDVDEVMQTYLRSMVPDVLLTERFGDVDMTDAFKRLREEHEAKSLAAKSEKARIALRKEYDAVVMRLAAIRDRTRNVYMADPKLRNAARLSANIKTYNMITDLGGVTLSSMPDIGGAIFLHGFGKVFRDGWRPFVKSLAGIRSGYAGARSQYKAMGIAVETQLAARMNDAYSMIDVYRPATRAERGLQTAGDAYFVATALGPWTDMHKTIVSVVSGNEIFRAAKAVTDGSASAGTIEKLAASGIDREMAGRIWRAFEKGGETIDGTHIPNTGDWTDRAARDAFEGAIGRDADMAVITPGAEKPLWMNRPLASLLGQYKSFVAGATERILIAGLQRSDAAAAQGLVAMVGAGMISYATYAFLTGRELSDNPADWIREGVSRSGVLGWIEEGRGFVEKATGGQADIYRLLGSDRPTSRYASRTALSQLLGPTWGKMEGLVIAGGNISQGSWSASDTRRLRRVTALQNLFYVRWLFDQVENGTNNLIGVDPLPGQPQRRQ